MDRYAQYAIVSSEEAVKDANFDFEKLAKGAAVPDVNKSGGADTGKDKKDTTLEKQKQFIERMKEIRRDFEISEATQDEKEIEALPDLPFFVVIRITPLAPLDPYIAVEDASFNTSIDSISEVLISNVEP